MPAQTNRHALGPGGGYAPLAALLAAILACAAVDGALQAGDKIAHLPPAPLDPLSVAIDLARGTLRWPRQATLILAGELLVLLAAGLVLWRVSRRGARTRLSVDRAARLMGTGSAIAPVTLANAKRTAARFGITRPGLPIARAVAGKQTLYGTWEDMSLDIWGPRRGKTTSRAVPTLLAAPGAAFATSNKADLYAATAGPRSELGRIWNFDPQQITTPAKPTWWWNPLTYVTSDAKASELTDAFVAASRDPNARTDAFFDKGGEQLAAYLLRAAALDNRPVTQALEWSTTPNDEEPVTILREHGLELSAASLLSSINAPDKQRDGLWATAHHALSFLRDPAIAAWVTDPSRSRPQLDLDALVRSTDTLYLHSKEGKGTSAGLVAALAMALCDAGEQLAIRSPGGRLATPIVGVLDEAANICRWTSLPDLYSHYGSRGIPLLTLLQSWSQGCAVWTEAGMQKLWGASNIRVYGGGSSEEKFLTTLEKLIGEYNRPVRTTSTSHHQNGGSRSTSVQLTPTPILTVAELSALPRGRVVVLPSGSPAVLAAPTPWWDTPHKDAIQASERRHDPAAAHAAAHQPPPPPVNPWITPA